MERFNIALLPCDVALHESCVDLAESYFGADQDGYILGRDALAHVTLCQFRAENEQLAIEVYDALDNSNPIELLIAEFRLLTGSEMHAGKTWAEIRIERTAELLERQKKCVQHLTDCGLETLTSMEAYSPHITLARLQKIPASVPSVEDVPRGRILFRPAVGFSTELGVFVRELDVN